MARARRTLAVAVGLALVVGACGDDDEAATRQGLVTLTYEGLLDDPAALGDAIKDRLAPIGIEVDGIDLDTPGEVGVALADDRVGALVADLLDEQGVLRFRPVLAVTPDPPADAPTTPAADDLADAEVVLPEADEKGEIVAVYRLGPTLLDGGIETAEAVLNSTGEWEVALTLLEAAADEFNRAAALCNAHATECPTGQLAIVLDGTVRSAPSISQPSYERDQIVIAGVGDEVTARRLARILDKGALPVDLTPTD